MIHNIFFDLDETLIHTSLIKPAYAHVEFKFLHDYFSPKIETFYTMFRPCANSVIKFARELVGKDRVYILTAAPKDYAIKMNESGNFGFDEDHIYSKEDIGKTRIHLAYGSHSVLANEKIAHKDNVLIDNMYPYCQLEKIAYIGMHNHAENYLQVTDYIGSDLFEDEFEDEVKQFLLERNER